MSILDGVLWHFSRQLNVFCTWNFCFLLNLFVFFLFRFSFLLLKKYAPHTFVSCVFLFFHLIVNTMKIYYQNRISMVKKGSSCCHVCVFKLNLWVYWNFCRKIRFWDDSYVYKHPTESKLREETLFFLLSFHIYFHEIIIVKYLPLPVSIHTPIAIRYLMLYVVDIRVGHGRLCVEHLHE